MAKKNGLNKEKVNELLSPVGEIIDKLAQEEQQMVEQIDEQIEQQMVEPPVEQMDEQMVAHQKRIEEIRSLLDLNIRKAIIYHKDDKNIGGLNEGQFKAIVDGYRKATGKDLNEERIECIKNINFNQASSVIYSINVCLKLTSQEKRNFDINKKLSEQSEQTA